MKDRIARTLGRLKAMVSDKQRLESYQDPDAHRRTAPDRDALLPANHTRTSIPPMGGTGSM